MSPRQRDEKIKPQRLLTECEFINIGQKKNTVGSELYNNFCSFQKQLIQISKPEHWKLQQIAKYSQSSKYKFSTLGDVFQHSLP